MKTLKYGSTGPLVEFLQNLLKHLGFYFGNIDGIFGYDTQNAVLNFQKSFGLSSIDGIIGPLSWNSLMPYIDGALGFIVPTNISYSYSILNINLNSLKKLYPFLEIGSIGSSVLGNSIPYVKLGSGSKQVFYSASFHANEWITSPVLMKFIADFCYCYKNDLTIYGYNARDIFNNCSIFIVPMVNPDGVNLVTGELKSDSPSFIFARNISDNFPAIPFVDGWKANIRGESLINFHLKYCVNSISL